MSAVAGHKGCGDRSDTIANQDLTYSTIYSSIDFEPTGHQSPPRRNTSVTPGQKAPAANAPPANASTTSTDSEHDDDNSSLHSENSGQESSLYIQTPSNDPYVGLASGIIVQNRNKRAFPWDTHLRLPYKHPRKRNDKGALVDGCYGEPHHKKSLPSSSHVSESSSVGSPLTRVWARTPCDICDGVRSGRFGRRCPASSHMRDRAHAGHKLPELVSKGVKKFFGHCKSLAKKNFPVDHDQSFRR